MSEPVRPERLTIAVVGDFECVVNQHDIRTVRMTIRGGFTAIEPFMSEIRRLSDWLQRAKEWAEYVPPEPFVPGHYWIRRCELSSEWTIKHIGAADHVGEFWVLGPRIEQPEECK